MTMTREELIQFVSDGFEKAKGGDAVNIYRQICPTQDDGTLPLKSHYAFGWIIYYALHQSPDKAIDDRKHMLGRYLKLSITVPHKLHSMILTEAVRLYRDSKDAAFGKKPEETVKFSILGFLKLWDLKNLRPGDWRRKEVDGKPVNSLAEKVITCGVSEAEETRQMPSPEFMQMMSKALTDFPNTPALLAQSATIHLLNGETDLAKELLKSAVLSAPAKFHLWAKLASTIDPKDEPHLHVALLYKALKAPGQEQFKGRIRLSLADTLSNRGAHPQALWELNRVKEVYEPNGWNLPRLHTTVSARIPKGTVPANPETLYRKVERLADDFIYESLPEIEATKTFHKLPNPNDKGRYGKPAVAWRVTDLDGNNYWFNPERMGISPDHPIGTKLNIRVHGGKLVKADVVSLEE